MTKFFLMDGDDKFVIQTDIFKNIDYKESFISSGLVTHFVEWDSRENKLIEKVRVEELDKSGEKTGDDLVARKGFQTFEDVVSLFW